MGKQLFSNNFNTYLAADISDTDTIIQLIDATLAPTITPGSNDWFLMTLIDSTATREIVKCTARTGVNCTVERAQEATTAIAFTLSPQTIISLRPTKGTMEQLQDDIASNTTINTTNTADIATHETEIIKGDGTANRAIRSFVMRIFEGSVNNSLKIDTLEGFNGDVIPEEDDLIRSGSTTSFELDSTGSIVTVKSSALTGNHVGTLSCHVSYNNNSLSTDILVDDERPATTNIVLKFTEASTGTDVDLTDAISTSARQLNIKVTYMTDL